MEQNKLWFKAKRYGWGWTPSSWEGWAVIVLYVVDVFLVTVLIDQYVSESISPWIALFGIVPSTAFLIIICYIKGEKPGWRWGKDTEENNEK